MDINDLKNLASNLELNISSCGEDINCIIGLIKDRYTSDNLNILLNQLYKTQEMIDEILELIFNEPEPELNF